MRRDQMINILIEDKIHNWVDARNTEELVATLEVGWKGFEQYSDEELRNAIANLCEDNFDDVTAGSIKVERVNLKLSKISRLESSLIKIFRNYEDMIVETLEKGD